MSDVYYLLIAAGLYAVTHLLVVAIANLADTPRSVK